MKNIFLILTLAGVAWSLPLGSAGLAAELSCKKIADARDDCLIGKWAMTDASKKLIETRIAKFIFSQVRARGGEITSISYPAPVAEFHGDGKWAFDHPMAIAGKMTDDGMTFSMKMDLKVNRDFGQWGSDGRTLLMCPQGGEHVGTMTMNIPGVGNHTIPMSNPAKDTELQSGRAAYTCSGATLNVTTEPTVWMETLNLTFKRVAR